MISMTANEQSQISDADLRDMRLSMEIVSTIQGDFSRDGLIQTVLPELLKMMNLLPSMTFYSELP